MHDPYVMDGNGPDMEHIKCEADTISRLAHWSDLAGQSRAGSTESA